jgi:hypothetical protein
MRSPLTNTVCLAVIAGWELPQVRKHNWSYLMRSTDDAVPTQSGRLLSLDELALPAVCGQTGKPFLMVVRRQGRRVIELIRAVGIEPARRANTPPRTQARDLSRAALSSGASRGVSEEPAVSFKALNMSARIHIGSLYEGCPYCHAPGYFHCSDCAMFSCWESYNERPHRDHTDVWCEACRLWKCTSDKGEDDESVSEVTAYAPCENTIDIRSPSAPVSTSRDQLNRPTSIRGYLR